MNNARRAPPPHFDFLASLVFVCVVTGVCFHKFGMAPIVADKLHIASSISSRVPSR